MSYICNLAVTMNPCSKANIDAQAILRSRQCNFDLGSHLVFLIGCCVARSKLARSVCLVLDSLLNVLVGSQKCQIEIDRIDLPCVRYFIQYVSEVPNDLVYTLVTYSDHIS